MSGGEGGGGKPHPLPIPEPHHHREEEGGDGNWLVSYADMMTLLVGFFVILLSFSKIDPGELEELKKAATTQFGGTYEIPFNDIADRIRQELIKKGYGDQFIIKQNELGVEISFLGTVFFNTASADLKPEGVKLLDALIPVIKVEPTKFKLVVEGHTDDVPIGAGFQYRTNWELSSVRACRVLDAFERAGFDKATMEAVGYADARPVAPNRDASGNPLPGNRNQNRRVVIKLLKSV